MDDQQRSAPAGEGGERDEGLSLPRAALLILLAPLIVFFVSDQLISNFGLPVDQPAPQMAFNGNAEAAGRLRLLGTFLLLLAASMTIVAHFALSLKRLDRTARRNVLALYLLVAGVGAVMLMVREHRETQEFVGQRLVCTALSLPDSPVLRPAHGNEPPSLADPDDCGADRYLVLRRLIEIERLLLMFAIPAVVLGAVTSLARCSETTPDESKREIRNRCIEQLNMSLYLAAMLMVIGLLFVGAFLNWPGYALEGGALAAYRSHASAIVLFYGATYSVLLASYYVPTVMLIANRPEPPAPCGQEGGDRPSLIPPFVLVRAGAAVFAPFIVSIMGDVVKLPI